MNGHEQVVGVQTLAPGFSGRQSAVTPLIEDWITPSTFISEAPLHQIPQDLLPK